MYRKSFFRQEHTQAKAENQSQLTNPRVFKILLFIIEFVIPSHIGFLEVRTLKKKEINCLKNQFVEI